MCEIPELGYLTLANAILPPLPLEIIDLVIDQLRKDKTTLKSCSLVCRDWVSRARHHLFFIFNARDGSSPALHLLQSPLCTIYPHVRGLNFGVDPTADIAAMLPVIREVDARATLLILRIRTVPCIHLTWINDVLLEFLPTLKNIRYLELYFLRFKSPGQRIKLFASLSALESLVTCGMDFHENDADSHSNGDQNSSLYAILPPKNLRHILIGVINISHELRWLTVHCEHPLTTLHLYDITSEGIPVLVNYLRRSSQLQCLSFDFHDQQTPESLQLDLTAQMDLRSHRDLRRLRLTSIQFLPILSNLLPQISSPRFEEITITTGGFYHPDFTCAALHEIFARSPAVRNLKRFYVDRADIDEISEVLPEFASRGIILPLRRRDFPRGTGALSSPPIPY